MAAAPDFMRLDNGLCAAHRGAAGNSADCDGDERALSADGHRLSANCSLVSLGAPVQFRDLRLVPVIVRRSATDAQSGEGVAYSRVDLSIEIPAGEIAPHTVSPAFDWLYREFALNYGIAADASRECYLMIVPDAFYDNAMALARWKELKGFEVVLKRKSEVGSTNTEIRNYIANAYHTWPTPPTYVLLIGTINQIPAFNIRDRG